LSDDVDARRNARLSGHRFDSNSASHALRAAGAASASLTTAGEQHDGIQCGAFRVKPGRDQEFLEAHKKIKADWPGLRRVNMIKTADSCYCIIAAWTDMDALAKARPAMIATLDSFRGTL
jgi:hypothetical protein